MKFAIVRHRSHLYLAEARELAAGTGRIQLPDAISIGQPETLVIQKRMSLEMFAVRNEASGEFARTQRLGISLRYASRCYYGRYEKSNQWN